MKKVLALLIILLLSINLVMANDAEAISAAKKMINIFLTETQDLIKGLNAAENGKEATVAIMKFGSAMKKMAAKGMVMAKKYPNFNPKKEPAIKKDLKKLKLLFNKLKMVIQKVTVKFSSDPEFVKALSKLGLGMTGNNQKK